MWVNHLQAIDKLAITGWISAIGQSTIGQSTITSCQLPNYHSSCQMTSQTLLQWHTQQLLTMALSCLKSAQVYISQYFHLHWHSISCYSVSLYITNLFTSTARKVVTNLFEFFVKSVNKDFYCLVSLEVMINTHQTDCCGNHVSADVSEGLAREGKPCPLCKAPVFTTRLDQYFQRIILDQRVRCPHGKVGCDWSGPLRELQQHSDSCRFHP